MMSPELAKKIVAADKKGRDLSQEMKMLNRQKQQLVDEMEDAMGCHDGWHEVGLDVWTAAVYYSTSTLLAGEHDLPSVHQASSGEKVFGMQ